MKYTFLACLPLTLALACHADIYKHVDEAGNITYTNIPTKRATRIQTDDSYTPAPQPKSTKNNGNVSPANFPTVDTPTQQRRDAGRKQLLEEEMSEEIRMLSEAQKLLTTASSAKPATPEKVARLQDSVTLHQKNIEALKKEIGSVKEY